MKDHRTEPLDDQIRRIGYAKLIDPWTVEVAFTDGRTQRQTTRAIIIATGAAPFVPPLPGLEDVGQLTSDTMWDKLRDRTEVPKRVVVLGAVRSGPRWRRPSQGSAPT